MKSRTRGVGHLPAILYLTGCVLAASLALGSWSSWAADGTKTLEPGIKHFGKSYNALVSANSGDFAPSKAVGKECANILPPPMPLYTLGQMRRH